MHFICRGYVKRPYKIAASTKLAQAYPFESTKLDQVFWMSGLTCLLFIQDLSFRVAFTAGKTRELQSDAKGVKLALNLEN
jgi:hypothetical protein